MPIFEVECYKHGKLEVFTAKNREEFEKEKKVCPRCGVPVLLVEWSRPGWRNPVHGEGG